MTAVAATEQETASISAYGPGRSTVSGQPLVVVKSSAVTRIHLPPHVNSLLSVADHCLKNENYVNVIVCDKQMHLQHLNMDEAITHRTKGTGMELVTCEEAFEN